MLVGKNVVLRPLKASDLSTWHELGDDVRHTGPFWPLAVSSQKSFRDRFDKDGLWSQQFSILLVTDRDDSPLGYVGFFPGPPYSNTREIGFRLFRRESHSQGIMSEAVALVVGYLFASLPIERVQAAAVIGNVASRRVLEKNGFALEGTMRGVTYCYGEYVDMDLFSILRHEAVPLHDLLAPIE